MVPYHMRCAARPKRGTDPAAAAGVAAAEPAVTSRGRGGGGGTRRGGGVWRVLGCLGDWGGEHVPAAGGRLAPRMVAVDPLVRPPPRSTRDGAGRSSGSGRYPP